MALDVGKLVVAGAAVAACVAGHGAPDQDAAPRGDAVNPYAEFSDRQWEELANTWEALDGSARRWFLTEARKRKIGRQRVSAVSRLVSLKPRARPRFGGVTGGSSAAVAVSSARIPTAADATPVDAKSFGLGFEQRRAGVGQVRTASGAVSGIPDAAPRLREHVGPAPRPRRPAARHARRTPEAS